MIGCIEPSSWRSQRSEEVKKTLFSPTSSIRCWIECARGFFWATHKNHPKSMSTIYRTKSNSKFTSKLTHIFSLLHFDMINWILSVADDKWIPKTISLLISSFSCWEMWALFPEEKNVCYLLARERETDADVVYRIIVVSSHVSNVQATYRPLTNFSRCWWYYPTWLDHGSCLSHIIITCSQRE